MQAYRFDDLNVFRRLKDGIAEKPDDPDLN